MQNYELVPIKKIKTLEFVFPNHLINLSTMIKKDKIMKYALVVEKEHNIVLDGSHRHIFLMMEGYKLAPVCYIDYSSEHVRLGTHRIHRLLVDTSINISKDEVIMRGITGNWFPPRTTRHFFPFLRQEINVPLSDLKKGMPRDVNKYIANVNINDEIIHNKKYIREIEEETDELITYLEESKRTKKYLLEQIREMEKKK